VPLYGCDCYAYALLVSGFVDLVVESGLKVSCGHLHFTLFFFFFFFFYVEEPLQGTYGYTSVLIEDK
jgi:hypothetical protein